MIGASEVLGLFGVGVWVLLRTYLEIIALRKGPDAIPSSWLVLLVSLAMLGGFWVLQVNAVDGLSSSQIVAALVGYALALAFYGTVVFLSGFGRRVLPAISTIIAVGSILSALALLESVLLGPLLGREVATDVATLIWFWSVPVKGHVMARTIQQHWFVGITIAMSAFILRIGVEAAFAGGQ